MIRKIGMKRGRKKLGEKERGVKERERERERERLDENR